MIPTDQFMNAAVPGQYESFSLVAEVEVGEMQRLRKFSD